MDTKNFKLIATGSASQVYHYSTKAGDFALKFVPNTCHKEIMHLSNEAKILAALDHDYIIKCLKYQQNLSLHGKKQNSQLRNFGNIMVLQYAPKGTLLNLISMGKLNQSDIKSLFKKVCQGVKHIHLKGYSHRDLKLQNILVFEENQKLIPKISDFGLSSYCYKDGELIKFNNIRGTKKGYMAPQIHQIQQSKEHSYDAVKTDIFSLGVIMFALVLGRLPFEYATKDDKIFKLIINQDYENFWKTHQNRMQKLKLTQNEQNLEKFKDLFVRMVHLNPQERPHINEILENSWFSF